MTVPARHFGFPFGFDSLGRTRGADGEAAHVRHLIEQLLFTAPGERVMRPEFGTGLAALLFQPASPERAAATRLLLQSALQQWLGDRILPLAVDVTAGDGSLEVFIQYQLLETGAEQTARFAVAAP